MNEVLDIFANQFRHCWACGVPDVFMATIAYTPGIDHARGLEIHHIVGGAGRVHERCNLSRLCSLCHRLLHGDRVPIHGGGHVPELRLDHILQIKFENDAKHYDRHRIRELRGKIYLPAARRLPTWFYRERLRWRR